MITKWVIKQQHEATQNLIEYLQNTVQLDPIAIKVLLTRDLRSPLEIEKFINPKIEDLYDPFLLKGMKEAVCLLEEMIANHKRILIHGDYDIDGVTSTSLLAKVLSKLKVNYITYIPDRLTEGYGLSKEAIDHAVKENVSLIITVDCGISAFDEVDYANTHGIKVIITDHHRPSENRVPAAEAVVNPWQAGCTYPCKELTGVGIAFKLSQALTSKVDHDVLDLVALGTVGDVANIIDENRIFVRFGLRTFERKTNVGLHELRRVSGIDHRKIVSSDLSFILGPRINATGRLGSAQNALELLMTSDKVVAQKYANILNDENIERQRIERQILEAALKQIEDDLEIEKKAVIVLWDQHWHQGVIGIIASRLVEKYYKPALIIAAENGGVCKGSGRSIKGIDLFEALSECSNLLVAFGGHEYAAGFEIKKDDLPQFRDRINQIISQKYAAALFQREICIDLAITFYDINKTLIKNLELFRPFGRGNAKPVFLTRRLRLIATPTKLRGGGAKFSLSDGEIMYDAIWFKPNGFELDCGIDYDAVYCLSFDTWFGFEKMILEIKDLQISDKSLIAEEKKQGSA